MRITKYNNPLGLEIGEFVTITAISTVEYDVKGNKDVHSRLLNKTTRIVGCVKKAIGKRIEDNCFGSSEDYAPPYLAVSKYIWLYECKNAIHEKSFLVLPENIEL